MSHTWKTRTFCTKKRCMGFMTGWSVSSISLQFFVSPQCKRLEAELLKHIIVMGGYDDTVVLKGSENEERQRPLGVC